MSAAVERRPRQADVLRAGDVAWVAALPCTVVTVALVALLGPPLGRTFLGPGSGATFWSGIVPQPEPVEHGRYLLSLLGPALLAAAVLAGARRLPPVPPRLARSWVLATQIALLAFLALCLAAQYDLVGSAYRPQWEMHARYFTPRTLLVAFLAPPLLLALLRRRMATRIARGATAVLARGVIAVSLAVAFTALWLLTAVYADGSLANAAHAVVANIAASMPEAFAILNGRTPLVDFHSQYGQLVPYVPAGTMALFGASIGTFTITMATLSGLALLAVYAVLRRIVRSSWLALALYAPVLATGFFVLIGPLEDRYSPANLYSLWPIRYGGPYLLAWLLARHLDGARPRRPWALFLVAGIVLVNNPEFGAGAAAALAVALVLVRPPGSRTVVGRLLAEAVGGLLGAVALVALLTLVRTGSLPHFGWALEFSKLYGMEGLALVPMPRIGVYLAVYVTFAAAIGLAAVRVVRREADTVLTAMLAWSGTFGLLAGAYFAGRSHPHVLIDMFSPWALALALLTVAVACSLAAGAWRRPSPAQLAVLFGFGLTVCSLAQTPTPWSQIERIRDQVPGSILKQSQSAAFIAERTSPGEKIAILIPLGHRIAYDIGRTNVLPYASTGAILTTQQMARAMAAVRAEGAHQLFISTVFTPDPMLQRFQLAGFAARAQVPEGSSTVVELEDGGS
jgi:hypothetical protein